MGLRKGHGLSLLAANTHSSTERGRFHYPAAPWTSEKRGGDKRRHRESGGRRGRGRWPAPRQPCLAPLLGTAAPAPTQKKWRRAKGARRRPRASRNTWGGP